MKTNTISRLNSYRIQLLLMSFKQNVWSNWLKYYIPPNMLWFLAVVAICYLLSVLFLFHSLCYSFSTVLSLQNFMNVMSSCGYLHAGFFVKQYIRPYQWKTYPMPNVNSRDTDQPVQEKEREVWLCSIWWHWTY